MLHDPTDGLHAHCAGDLRVVAFGHELILATLVGFTGPQGDVVVAAVGRHAHEGLGHEAGEGPQLTAHLLADLAVGGETVGGQLSPVEVEVQLQLSRGVLVVALNHVQAHGLGILHHLVDQRLELGELVDVVTVGLGHPLHSGLAIGVGLQPHHLRLGAGTQVETRLFLEGLVDPLQVATTVRGQEHSAVDLLLAAPEQGAEHPGRLGVPGELHEGVDLGHADQLAGLRAIADVLAVAVDEQVGRGPVDQLEALVGDGAEVLSRDALTHDAPGDGHELAVQVLDAVGLDLSFNLGHL